MPAISDATWERFAPYLVNAATHNPDDLKALFETLEVTPLVTLKNGLIVIEKARLQVIEDQAAADNAGAAIP